jgi:arabinogalactan endo-1,4-beta-galactosidase
MAIACSVACAEKKEFLLGGDISMLAEIEKRGGVYRDGSGPGDMIRIMTDHGCNCFRLRLFVKPNHVNAVVNDLAYTLSLAARIKKAGVKLLLDFHYSDTWADPGNQTKPAAWSKLDFDALEKTVEKYTAGVMAEFGRKGIMPDIVQIGNEITPGMLWPEGKLKGDDEKQWDCFTRLLKAGVRGVESTTGTDKVRIMIHSHLGGNRKRTRWFFSHVVQRGVRCDIIGLSYYPWWHGKMKDLKDNLWATAESFKRDVVVVETAYPYRRAEQWKKKPNMEYPVSQQGQKEFMTRLIETVRAVPGGRGAGVIYWYPESIPVKGLRIWNGGSAALFDEKGVVLPAMKAFETAPKTVPPRP